MKRDWRWWWRTFLRQWRRGVVWCHVDFKRWKPVCEISQIFVFKSYILFFLCFFFIFCVFVRFNKNNYHVWLIFLLKLYCVCEVVRRKTYNWNHWTKVVYKDNFLFWLIFISILVFMQFFLCFTVFSILLYVFTILAILFILKHYPIGCGSQQQISQTNQFFLVNLNLLKLAYLQFI